MQIIKSALFAATALVAVQAHAAYDYTFTSVPAATYGAPSFIDGVKASVESTSVTNVYLKPMGVTGDYLVVSSQGGSAGYATIETHDVSSYSFVWGSPDTFNSVAIFDQNGVVTNFSGTDLMTMVGFQMNGNNAYTGLFTITGTDGSLIKQLTLSSTGVAFEVAAAVPEPETYALMFAGLGAVGFMARRRNRG